MAQNGRRAAVRALVFKDQRRRGRPPNLARATLRVATIARGMSDRTFARFWWAAQVLIRTEGEAGLEAAITRSLWKNKTLNVAQFRREADRAFRAAARRRGQVVVLRGRG